MKILFISDADPRDRRTWSGTAWYEYQSLLSLGHQVDIAVPPPVGIWSLWEKIRWQWTYLLKKKYRLSDVSPLYRRALRRALSRKFRADDYDLIFGYHPFYLTLLPTTRPIVFWSDATFRQSVPGYFSRATPQSLQAGFDVEGDMLKRSFAAVFSSDWAAKSAVQDYGCPPAKVHVIPFGANIDRVPDSQTVHDAIDRKITRWPGDVRLLFIGLDWDRKDGDTALAIVDAMRNQGIGATLTIVGSPPGPKASDKSWVKYAGKFNKNNPAELAKFNEIYLENDFYVMTSRNESYGIVYCEAMAHGLPSLAADVGGVGTIVQNGRTGILIERTPKLAQDLADRAIQLIRSPQQYAALAHSSRTCYEQRFNWKAAEASIGAILDKAKNASASGAPKT